jgi:LacI family transcriptional regulator
MTQKRKKIKMADVAREAGVSLTTVGQVLLKSGGKNVRVSPKTAERILAIATKLNYTPNQTARQLAGKKSNIIGVLIDPVASPQSTNRLAEIEALIHQRGFRLMIGHPMNDPGQTAKYVEDFLARGVEGVICIHHAYPGREKLVPIEVQKLPNVVFIKKPAIDDSCYIDIDETDGTKQIVEHLRKRGAKRIAIALTDDRWPGNRQRLLGYREALGDEGKLIWTAIDRMQINDLHHISAEDADIIIDDLVRIKEVDAIITMNDYWAARIIVCLQKQGFKVPDDVKVVGYDNLDIGTYIEPNITTLDQKQRLSARLAIEMLFKLISGEITKKEKSVIIKPQLLIRQSS